MAHTKRSSMLEGLDPEQAQAFIHSGTVPVEKKEIKQAIKQQANGQQPPEVLVTYTCRLPMGILNELRREATERKVAREYPASQQEIILEALKEWFARHRKRKMG